MKIVAPLAGPDFLTEAFGLRPLHDVDGEQLFHRVMHSRPWRHATSNEDLCVVVRQTERTPEFRAWLAEEFPGSRVVELPGLTCGALQSTLAGVAAIVDDPNEPLCIDLADILFDAPWPAIAAALQRGATVAPCFDSDDPDYSYLELAPDRTALRTAEKQVISRHASVGVYLFPDAATFFTAAQYAHRAWAAGAPRALFVCPALNGLIEQGRSVLGLEASGVRPIGKVFHGRGNG
jgi:hypothetical protein